jgi:hypothetical protein
LPPKLPSTRIENRTRGVTIVVAGRVADSFWSNFRGLMLAPPLPPGAGLVIVPCSSIHTQFMRFPMDDDHTLKLRLAALCRILCFALGANRNWTSSASPRHSELVSEHKWC